MGSVDDNQSSLEVGESVAQAMDGGSTLGSNLGESGGDDQAGENQTPLEDQVDAVPIKG